MLLFSLRQINYILLTRSPLICIYSKLYTVLVRLACVKHAASVHSEPGSNSTLKKLSLDLFCFLSQNYLSNSSDFILKIYNILSYTIYLFCLCSVYKNYILYPIIFKELSIPNLSLLKLNLNYIQFAPVLSTFLP